VTVFGIGIDVVENARIADLIRSHGQRFLDRVYQPGEIEYCRSMRINWRDIEVRRKASGEPFVVLHAGAAELAKGLNIETVLVSLSHSRAYAVANALLLKSANQ